MGGKALFCSCVGRWARDARDVLAVEALFNQDREDQAGARTGFERLHRSELSHRSKSLFPGLLVRVVTAHPNGPVPFSTLC